MYRRILNRQINLLDATKAVVYEDRNIRNILNNTHRKRVQPTTYKLQKAIRSSNHLPIKTLGIPFVVMKTKNDK